MKEIQEMWVQHLGQGDPLEKEMTTQSSIIVWEIPWTEELGKRQLMWSQRVRHDWACTHTHTHTDTHTHTPMVSSGCLPGQFILSHHHKDKGTDCEFLENTVQAVFAITTSMQPIQEDSSWLIQWMLINNTPATVLIHVNNTHKINTI